MPQRRPKVYISRRLPEQGLQQLIEHCDVTIHDSDEPPDRELLLQAIADCDAVITLLTEHVDEEFLTAAGPNLKVVANYAVGYDNIDVQAATAHHVQVGNTPDVLTAATADLAVTLILGAARHVLAAANTVQAGRWQTWEPCGFLGQELYGKTLGIVGMGRIGQATARRLHFGWQMPVLYTSRSAKAEAEQELNCRRVPLETLLSEADVISVHCPLNDETRGMFDADAFQRMKSSAIFVNTARGPLHDSTALYAALRSGEIFAAGLDVTDPEPLPADDPLLTLPNCLILPHIGSATISARVQMAELAVKNVLAGLRGDPLPACVN